MSMVWNTSDHCLNVDTLGKKMSVLWAVGSGYALDSPNNGGVVLPLEMARRASASKCTRITCILNTVVEPPTVVEAS